MVEPELYDLKVHLSLGQAEIITNAALAAGKGGDMLPLTVVVLDMGIPGRTIQDPLGQRPAFQGSLVGASDGKFVPVPGGVLVLDTDGKAIGAVGISGDTSEKDEFCAIQGIKAAGLASAPSEPNESWKASSL